MLTLRLLRVERPDAGAIFPTNIFTVQAGLATYELACMLDSLVRVSRRGEWNRQPPSSTCTTQLGMFTHPEMGCQMPSVALVQHAVAGL